MVSVFGIIITVSGRATSVFLSFSMPLGFILAAINAGGAACLIKWMDWTPDDITYECDYDYGEVWDSARCRRAHRYQRTSYAAGYMLAITG